MLEIIIVGSGLAGLTAARVLREHHRVTVYERGDKRIATGGQGIMIAPNGHNILESLGYEPNRAGAVPIRGIRFYDKQDNVTEDIDLDLKTQFGAEYMSQKRSDFRDELLRLATTASTTLGIAGDPAKIIFDTSVIGLEPESGTVRLSDGSTVTADAVIIADGVHSKLRDIVLENDLSVVKKTGLTCYRIAISTEDAKKALGNLPLPHWWEPSTCKNRSSLIHAMDGTSRMVTAYPIRNQTMFNLSCIIRTEDSMKSTTESWHANGDPTRMVDMFRDFPESLVKILSAATEVKVWELQDLDPIPTWNRGRAILIGDAAHAMTPMQGQGANMCIEDAEAFQLLVPGTRREDVKDILEMIGTVRKARTAEVLAETRKSHSTTGVGQRVVNNLEFNCGYKGIFEAVKSFG